MLKRKGAKVSAKGANLYKHESSDIYLTEPVHVKTTQIGEHLPLTIYH